MPAPKGKAKSLRQKDRVMTMLRESVACRTPKVQPAFAGNLSGTQAKAQNHCGFVPFIMQSAPPSTI